MGLEMFEPIRQGDIPGVQTRHRCLLSVGPVEAWDWLTVAGRLEAWLARRATCEPGVGGSLVLEREHESGEVVVETGVIRAWEPGSLLTLDFRCDDPAWESTTRLELTLSTTEEGSELMLFHEGFQRLRISACLTLWESYRRHWPLALARLARAIRDSS